MDVHTFKSSNLRRHVRRSALWLGRDLLAVSVNSDRHLRHAARHHQLHCPWLGERSRAGIGLLRGAMSPEMGRAEDVAKKVRNLMDEVSYAFPPQGGTLVRMVKKL